MTVRYLDLLGDPYEDRWSINPLLCEEEPVGVGGYKGMNDLVQAIENLSADVEKVSRSVDALVPLVQGGSQTEETSWGK